MLLFDSPSATLIVGRLANEPARQRTQAAWHSTVSPVASKGQGRARSHLAGVDLLC